MPLLVLVSLGVSAVLTVASNGQEEAAPIVEAQAALVPNEGEDERAEAPVSIEIFALRDAAHGPRTWRPCVLLLADRPEWARALARLGFVAVGVEGSFARVDRATKVRVPTRKAIRSVLRYLRDEALVLNLDPERIAVIGEGSTADAALRMGFEDGEGDRPLVRACVGIANGEGASAGQGEPASIPEPLPASGGAPRLELGADDGDGALDAVSTFLLRELLPTHGALLVALDFDSTAEEERARFDFVDPECWKISGYGRGRALALFEKASSYAPPHRSPLHFAILKDAQVLGGRIGDFVLDVDLRSTHEPYAHRDLCIAFGWRDPDHFYYAHLGQNADPSSHTILVVDGADRAPIVERRTEGIAWDEHWHRVRLERDTQLGTIRVYYDDFEHPVLEATDTRFGVGRIALGSFDDTGEFDTLRLRSR